MKFNFRDLPIRRKLTLIVLLTCAAALVFVSVAMVTYDILRFRHSLVRELSTEAEIVAENSAAALAFSDTAAARETLKALQAQPGIVQARLFTADGKIFAEYKSKEVSRDLPELTTQTAGHRFEPGFLLVFRDVIFGHDIVGSLALRSDLREQNAWLKAGVSIAVVALLAALLVALILSMKLQRIISTPILELAGLARQVAAKKNYSLRAVKLSEDEIGLLTEEFNQMLGQIELRDADLRASEERFRQLAESIREVFWLSDVEKKKVFYISPGFELVWGRSRDELQRNPELWTEAIHHEDAARIHTAVSAMQAVGKYDEEYRIIRPDGAIRWIHDRAFPVRDDAGEIYRIAGIAEDITGRKLAEEALQTAEAKYRNIFENATEGIFQTTPGGRFLAANPALARMLGYASPEELIAAISDLGAQLCVNPETRDELQRQLQTEPEVRKFENQIRRKDGSLIWVSLNVRVARDSDGNALYYEGISSDITERKRFEEALRQSETQYRAIFESATEGIFQTTAEGKFLRANPALARMFGYESPEALAFHVTDIEKQTYVSPDRRKEFKRLLELHGEIHGLEAERLRRDGSRFWLSINARMVRDGDGAVLYYEGTTRDVTARRRLEKQLIEISDREQSRMGQDLHDGLCQHLVRTAFAANLLEKDLAGQNSAPKEQARKVSQLVDDAITQARNLARGLYPVKLENEGLHSAMLELAANIRAAYHLDCAFESTDSVSIHDHAVAVHLYRIAQEAAINAVKHANARQIQIRVSSAGEKICLIISDDGVGIPAPSARGSGMGLHIMNYRAGMIGAELQVEARPGGGTIVTCAFDSGNSIEKNPDQIL